MKDLTFDSSSRDEGIRGVAMSSPCSSIATTSFAAAIFDFDGTLVDTMPVHFEAYRRVLAEVGLELEPEDFYRNIGGHGRETIPKLLRGRACSLTPAEIH